MFGVIAAQQKLPWFTGGRQGGLWLVSPSTCFTTSAGSTPSTVGSKVGKLLDLSGNGWHFTCLDATRPTLRQDANGCYYLEFDGTALYMSVASSAATFKFMHDGTGCTVCSAAALDTSPAINTNYRIIGTGYTATLAGAGIAYITGSPAASTGYCNLKIGNGSANVVNTSSALGDIREDGVAQVALYTYKTQSGSDAHFYVDGFQPTAAGVAESNTPSSGSAASDLYLSSNTASTYFKGKFYGAVIIAAELGAGERQSLARYMRNLYSDFGYLLGVGDSHTYNVSYGQNRRDFYPARLDVGMRTATRLASINYGVSGDTTSKIITRLSNVTEAGYGAVAVIYVGTNDLNAATTVQASPAPTTSTFSVGAGKGVYYSAGGLISVNGVSCTVLSVATDAITLTAPLGFTPSAGQAVAMRTTDGIVAIGQALMAAGYLNLIVCGQHYLNFATGGDTLATPLAANAALRVLQQAGATALGALYVDFYAFMRALIVAGTYTQGDDTAWHVAVGNTHLNNTGEQILANALQAAIVAAGWTF